MPTVLTHDDYLGWVKRSLNRLLGASLPDDGTDTTEYRDWVEEFQFAYMISSPKREVDEGTQNALIKANHRDPIYVDWVNEALTKVGAGKALNIDGIWDPASKKALLAFQAEEGLSKDGWVGARTETALIAATKIPPPGSREVPKPKPKRPKPSPEIPWGNVHTAERQARRWTSTLFWAIFYGNDTVGPLEVDRLRIRCMLEKLKNPSMDDLYIPKQGAKDFFPWGEDAALGGRDAPEIRAKFPAVPKHAREFLTEEVRKLQMTEVHYEDAYRAFKKKVEALCLDIDGALIYINNKYTLSWHANLAVDLMHDWSFERQKKSSSILSCFKKYT